MRKHLQIGVLVGCLKFAGKLTADNDNFLDYLKYDNCYNEGQSGTSLITYNRYNAMSKALNATGECH